MSDQPAGTSASFGGIAKAPFAVLPDPATLFLSRSKRFRALAPGSTLEPYLMFLACVSEGQHAIQDHVPPIAMPPARAMTQALAHGMPAVSRFAMQPDPVAEATVMSLLDWLAERALPAPTLQAIAYLKAATSPELQQIASAVLKNAGPADDLTRHGLVEMGLQVHVTRIAANLHAADLTPVADAACPVCGSAPMTSSIVGWPNARNARYCNCALCGTRWNVVRVKCLLCGATDGITYKMIEGQPASIKAESCASCRTYVKVLYEVDEPGLDPLADDVASLGLDMLMTGENWIRGGQNPFLLGY